MLQFLRKALFSSIDNIVSKRHLGVMAHELIFLWKLKITKIRVLILFGVGIEGSSAHEVNQSRPW